MDDLLQTLPLPDDWPMGSQQNTEKAVRPGSRLVTSGHVILFINVKSSISNQPLSQRRHLPLLCLLLSVTCPVSLPSVPNLAYWLPTPFVEVFYKNKVLLSVHTFPLGKLLPP